MKGRRWIRVAAGVISFSINPLFCRFPCCFTTTVTTFKKQKNNKLVQWPVEVALAVRGAYGRPWQRGARVSVFYRKHWLCLD
jgi:hypothetical protein